MRAKLVPLVLITVGLVSLAVPAEDRTPSVKVIGDKVVCLCGCVAILNHCPHQDCSTHDEVEAVIEKAIAEGQGEPQILQALVERYGVKILAAPPVQGFNLTAWILPGLGLIVGLGLVVAVVKRWRRPVGESVPVSASPADPKLLAAVEEEMKIAGVEVRQ
jgi:hypothetical protein